ncbi:alpha-glucosidase [Spirochaetia bacterium]|nr:alpha-glucosidase [Spirochaetia bacterium]
MSGTAKIGIIGAGSAEFSAGIVRDLCINKDLAGSQVCFMDVDEKRLEKIHALALKITDELGVKLKFEKTLKAEDAIKGADFILNTVQIGGHSWVEAERALGEKHGYYRGAPVYSLNQMIFFVETAKQIEALSPNAYLIQSANPVFEGCTLMTRETKTKVIGLCHGHYGYSDICRVIGIPWEEVSANMIGFNHWIWLTEFRWKGKDAYPLIDEWIKTKAEAYWKRPDPYFMDNQMSRAAVELYQLYGLFPIGDTPRMVAWWHNDSLESKKKYYGAVGGFDSEIGWGQYLELTAERIALVGKAADDPGVKATDIFKPVQSGEQITPIINSIVNDKPAQYQVNIPNRGGVIHGFPEDLVVECRAIIGGGGISALMEPPLPESIMSGVMIPRWSDAETVLYAAKECSYNAILRLLLQDRRTKSIDQAKAFLDEWLADPRNTYVNKRLKGKK